MDGHGVIKVLFGRAHAHGHRKSLDHLIGARSDDVYTNHLLLRANRHQLHVSTRLAGRHRMVHGHKPRPVYHYSFVTKLNSGGGFSEPHRPDGWMTKPHSRNV